MKKLFLVFVLFVCMVSVCRSQGLTEDSSGKKDLETTVFHDFKRSQLIEPSFTLGIQDLKIATFYDFRRSQLLIGGILSIAEYKQLISLDVGLITQISTSRVFIFGTGINLFELFRRSFNWTYKLKEPLTTGIWLGKSIEKRDTYSGIYTGFELKF